jgi:hypothetical protein
MRKMKLISFWGRKWSCFKVYIYITFNEHFENVHFMQPMRRFDTHSWEPQHALAKPNFFFCWRWEKGGVGCENVFLEFRHSHHVIRMFSIMLPIYSPISHVFFNFFYNTIFYPTSYAKKISFVNYVNTLTNSMVIKLFSNYTMSKVT